MTNVLIKPAIILIQCNLILVLLMKKIGHSEWSLVVLASIFLSVLIVLLLTSKKREHILFAYNKIEQAITVILTNIVFGVAYLFNYLPAILLRKKLTRTERKVVLDNFNFNSPYQTEQK